MNIKTLIVILIMAVAPACVGEDIFVFDGELISSDCQKEDRLGLSFEVDLSEENPIAGWECMTAEDENSTTLWCTRGGEGEELSCHWGETQATCEHVIYDRDEGETCISAWRDDYR